MGNFVPFFKKNKPKLKKQTIAKEQEQTRLEKEIAELDRERHLDMQLEELSAQLNMPSDTPEVTDILELNSMEEIDIEKSYFITDSLAAFTPPSFTAKVSEKTKSIDVTSKETPDTDIETLLTDAHEITDNDMTAETAAPEPSSGKPQQTDELPNISSDIPLTGPNRLDVGAMRLDVAKISADIQSGEEIYRRALQRVEGLMGFVEKAEVDFSVLNRLEPENRRLKAKLRTSQGEVQTINGKLALIAADLEDHQNRLSEKTSQYEQARSKLVTAANSLQEYERVLRTTKAEAERYALAVERNKTALGVEGRENKVLREKIGELSEALELRQAESLEASKVVESLRSDCADFRDQADTYRSETQDLRIALNTAKRQNNAMKGEMQTLHGDIKTFKTQYEFNVINREDQITDLEQQIAFLAKEVDTKTEIANSANQDVAALRSIRNEQDIERDRLEKQLAAAHEEIKDITTLSEAQHSEKLKALETEVEELQAELIRRDEATKHTVKETNDLKREYKVLEMEREQLQSRLNMQSEQLENTIKNNPADDLQAQIDSLTEQLRVKNAIVQSAAQDVATLQKARDAQDLENKRLEELIHTQTFQLEAAQKELLHSKQNLSGDDVEDRIMDYKFGIRKDII